MRVGVVVSVGIEVPRARASIAGLQALATRGWESPTIMTWASIGARLFSFTIVLPILLRRLTAAEIAVWYLFATIIGLQMIADTGFAPTFARAIAYAMGGATDVGDFRERRPRTQTGTPNWRLLGSLRATASAIYWRLAVCAFLVFGVAGSFAVAHPIAALADPHSGWIAWCAVLVSTAISLRGNYYSAYLQGMNQVAIVRRWEMLTSLGASVTTSVALLMGGRLIALAIANQAWTVVVVFRDWQLGRRLTVPIEARPAASVLDPDVMAQVWPRAWRSAVGIGASRGLIYASGIVYAQIAPAAAVASYLLAFRFIQTISEFSQAPFYSKLPVLGRLCSENNWEEMVALSAKGMRLAYWTFAAGFLVLGFGGTPILHLLRSSVPFVPLRLWGLMGLAVFVERYGAMHMQLYSLTNHILWHIANGITGIVLTVATALMLRPLGVYAFPLGMLVGYLSFYSWWSALLAWRAFEIRISRFEASTAAVPLALVLGYLVFALVRA
ncbi:MAG TPA: hypothetical protein VGM67_02810 [Gemmatimonadaceae bacterium]|jgi:hypothetical protein